MKADRRTFLKGAAATTGVVALGAPAVLGQAKPKVVVIGGGPGGATAAKYIARDAKGAVDVVLVEPLKEFVTCFHSNLYLGGFKTFEEITHTYDKLSGYGVKLAHQMASAIDRDKKLVRLADGVTLAYDRLVVSPGIDLKYDSVPGWGKEHEETMPHAWKPGAQTKLLKAKLDAVPDGGVIVMIAPPNPYRCPPGPYERASMMAHVLKTAGKTKAKVVIIDPKSSFSKQGVFQEGWEKHFPGMIEWMGPDIHSGLKGVDPKTNTVETGFETYRNCALVNVIPKQSAGKIALDAGLANEFGLLSDQARVDAVDDRCQHLCARRRVDRWCHAQVGLRREQSGQGCRADGPGRADQVADVPRTLCQHVLVADHDRRHDQGRRQLRGEGRQDRLGGFVRVEAR